MTHLDQTRDECSAAEPDEDGLCPAAVADGKLIAGIGREEFGYKAEAVGEGLRCQEGVLALTQLGVVEVDGEGEEVDGDGVGEGAIEEGGLGTLVHDGLSFGACLGAVAC
jgi:hypothetical protein